MPAQDTPSPIEPEVQDLLSQILSGVQAVLGQTFVGMYLTGSLATGSFKPGRSDIDFVVVTDGELDPDQIDALAAMHDRLAAGSSEWALKLDGSYIPQQALRRYDPAHTRHPTIGVGGEFVIGQHGPDWIVQRYILREQGVALAGPPLRSLIDPVEPDDLRSGVQGTLEEWWAPQLDDPHRLQSREYQTYAVLTMCRGLYTLHHGLIAPKPVAARWAQQVLGEPWTGLIERALAWPDGWQPDEFEDTLSLIRETIERARKIWSPNTDS